MTSSLDLNQIEKRAFRSMHQDGLWDIYIGGIVLSLSVLTYSNYGEINLLLRFGLFLVGAAIFYMVYWAGKRYLTAPRLGQVKFGPYRQRRKLIMLLVLAGIVLLQVIILIGTILLWRFPEQAMLLPVNPDLERLIVAIIGALFVGPSMLLISYFRDFLRGYYIAFILSLAVFALIWFDEPIYLVLAALPIIIPGIVLFIRFMIQHPLPPAEASHE